MRAVFAILFVAAMLLVTPAAADPHWCAIWSDGARTCSYPSLARCQEAISGVAGRCTEEAAKAAPASARPAKAASPQDDGLDRVLERVNKKSDSLILCRGC